MIKVLASAILFISMLTYCNYSYSSPKTIEYFAGHRDTPKHLNTDELELCIENSLLLEKSQELETISGLLSEEFLEANKKLQDMYADIYSEKCAGASYFKQDYDSSIKTLNSEIDNIITFHITSLIEEHLNFPILTVSSYGDISYNLPENLLENKYFLADPYFHSLLGLVQIDPLGDLKKTIRIKSALNLRRSKAGIKKKPDK